MPRRTRCFFIERGTSMHPFASQRALSRQRSMCVGNTYLGGHRPPLQFHRHTQELAAAQRKSPRMICRARDTNTLVGNQIENRTRSTSEAVPRIGAEIHFMMAICDIEHLCEFARPWTELASINDTAALLHQRDSTAWFERTNQ